MYSFLQKLLHSNVESSQDRFRILDWRHLSQMCSSGPQGSSDLAKTPEEEKEEKSQFTFDKIIHDTSYK